MKDLIDRKQKTKALMYKRLWWCILGSVMVIFAFFFVNSFAFPCFLAPPLSTISLVIRVQNITLTSSHVHMYTMSCGIVSSFSLKRGPLRFCVKFARRARCPAPLASFSHSPSLPSSLPLSFSLNNHAAMFFSPRSPHEHQGLKFF
jgi:hypothetical protein